MTTPSILLHDPKLLQAAALNAVAELPELLMRPGSRWQLKDGQWVLPAVERRTALVEILSDPTAVERVAPEAVPGHIVKLAAAQGALATRLRARDVLHVDQAFASGPTTTAHVGEVAALVRDPNALLTENEVCELLRISKETILKAKRDPLDPIPYKKVGGRYLYDRAEVMRWTTRQGERDWKRRTQGQRRSGPR